MSFSRQLFLKIAFAALLVQVHSPGYAADEQSFDAFKREQTEQAAAVKTEFADYEKQLLEEFAAYKQAYDEAFEQYKEKIEKKWGEFKTGDREVWITYTSNNNVRRTVDFKNHTITIEKISSASQLSKSQLKDFMMELPSLLVETEAQSFQNDEVAMQVEQTLANKKDLVEQSKLSNRPVLISLIPDLKKVDMHTLGTIANQLSENTNIESRRSSVKGKTIHTVRYRLAKNNNNQIETYAPTIETSSQKEKLPPALVYAVTEAESNFNPFARSDAPAYGLMQIVPSSGGKDATRYLFGKPKVLAPSYLYNGDNNVTIGAAYLHVLYYDQLNVIENPESRLLCAIAAYNTGVGNVAKAFGDGSNIKTVAPVINQLTPQQVFEALSANLPYEETRVYIKTVTVKMEKYQPRS